MEETWVLRMPGLVEIVVGCQMRDLAGDGRPGDGQFWGKGKTFVHLT